MERETIIAECHRLAAAVAPELPTLYILGAPPDGMPAPSHSTAWATPQHVEPFTKAHLESRGAWRGPAPAIVLQLDRLLRECIDPLATFAHELTHCLPARPIAEPESSAAAVRNGQRYSILWAELPADRFADGPEPWHSDHGDRFIRIFIHVCHRAWEHDFKFLAGGCAAGERYGLSHLLKYAAALDDEPQRLMGSTFAEIEATPVPQAFADLWAADVARYTNGATV
ncbi:MAG: hypothetical protein K8T25_18095 [Planctomycetia bacterium]|nr:hypothetical protein [Planctomycetia bacterium]